MASLDLVSLSQIECDQQQWNWRVTVSSKSMSCTISSFQTSWVLRMNLRSQSTSYSFGQSRSQPQSFFPSLELCLFGGAEFSEISYEIDMNLLHESKSNDSGKVKEACVSVNTTLIGKYRGNAYFQRNQFESLTSSSPETNVSVGTKIEVRIYIKTIMAKNVVTIPPNTFSADFQKDIESNEEFQDVTLIVGKDKEKIKANKFMLMVRSPVFARMFQADMKEKNTNVVKIPKISPKVFKTVLSYIYCGYVSKFLSLEETISMMDTANQYELNHLKALCENRLAISLNTNNAAHILAVAEAYACSELKKEAIEYITQSNGMCRIVMQTEGWKEVKERLMEDVLRSTVDPSPKKRKLVDE